MDGLTDTEIRNNTKEIKRLLCELRFEILNGYKNNTLVPKDCSLKERNTIIVENDLKDIQKSDVFLADYSIPNRNYVGCTFEMAYAFLWKKKIIVYVGDSGNENRIFLQYHASHICRDLEELKNVLTNREIISK